MTLMMEPLLRIIAGSFVIASVLLAMTVHPGFLWFTLFVGLNLVVSGPLNWCPMMSLLRRLGVQECVSRSGPGPASR